MISRIWGSLTAAAGNLEAPKGACQCRCIKHEITPGHQAPVRRPSPPGSRKFRSSYCLQAEQKKENISLPGVRVSYDSKKRMLLNMRREEYISDEMVVKRVNAAVRIELEKKRAMDVPIIVYNRDKQIIYKESSDGSRVEAGRRMRKGRYNERAAKKA